jgi:ribonuclease VapC
MVIDTSAIVAILLNEPLADTLGPIILGADAEMAARSYLEAHIVLKKHFGDRTDFVLDRRCRDLGIRVVEFTAEHALAAVRAFDTYGKGRHPVGLNFGDCISYGVAKASRQTLLYVGDDFSLTDIRPGLVL